MLITRFSPSPTGKTSIANLKIILLNWIYSKKLNGILILRIDDTNLKKVKIKFIKNFLKIFKKNKIKIKKSFFQSNKFYRYIEIIQFLIKKNISYKNYKNKKQKFNFIYKKLNKKFKFKKKKNKKFNKNYTIYIFTKKIKEKKKIKNILLIKINGIPIYNYSSVIDDNETNIKVIIRGIDHHENLEKQINILKFIKKKINKIIHIPMILNSEGKKISKSNNKNKINFYYKKLFLKESIINYVFNIKTKKSKFKVTSINDFIKKFKIKKEKKSYFKTNEKNIKWFNKFFFIKKNINSNYNEIKKNIWKKNKKKKFLIKKTKNLIKIYKKELNIMDIKNIILRIKKTNFLNIKEIKKKINKNIFLEIIKNKKKIYKKNFFIKKNYLIEKNLLHKFIKILILEKINFKNYLNILKKDNKNLIKNKIKIAIKTIRIFIKSLSSKG